MQDCASTAYRCLTLRNWGLLDPSPVSFSANTITLDHFVGELLPPAKPFEHRLSVDDDMHHTSYRAEKRGLNIASTLKFTPDCASTNLDTAFGEGSSSSSLYSCICRLWARTWTSKPGHSDRMAMIRTSLIAPGVLRNTVGLQSDTSGLSCRG
jgi:hypothetical protein